MKMATSKLLGYNLTKCWKVTWDGLVSHPGGVEILPVASYTTETGDKVGLMGILARPITFGFDFTLYRPSDWLCASLGSVFLKPIRRESPEKKMFFAGIT